MDVLCYQNLLEETEAGDIYAAGEIPNLINYYLQVGTRCCCPSPDSSFWWEFESAFDIKSEMLMSLFCAKRE